MRRIALFLVWLCTLPLSLHAELPGESFLYLLARGDSIPRTLVDASVLAHSERLGVVYDNAPVKALIGLELPRSITRALHDGHAILASTEAGGFSRLTVTGAADSASVGLWFRNGLWVPAYVPLTQSWTRQESRFFRVLIEDPARFNSEIPAHLDRFVEQTALRLGISEAQLALLEQSKIDYLLCASGDSVRRLTGHEARGIFLLGGDAVVSSLPCHDHEIVHLLVNFRLQNPPLYTHPFLQEGLATALGGRDGKSAAVIAQLGAYLLRSGNLTPGDVLAGNAFLARDASLTYPVAGALNAFLLELLPIDEYLSLYRRHSGPTPESRSGRVILPPDAFEWEDWLARTDFSTLLPLRRELPGDPDSDSLLVIVARGMLSVQCPSGVILVGGDGTIREPAGATLSRILPGHAWHGERYLIRMESAEMAVYDLATETMIAVWSAGLSDTPVEMPEDGILRASLLGGLPEGTWHPADFHRVAIPDSWTDN